MTKQSFLSSLIFLSGLSGCGFICEKRHEKQFETVAESVDLFVIDNAYFNKCMDAETEGCQKSSFVPGEMIYTEGIETFLTCEDICEMTKSLHITKIESCELTVNWETVPAQYRHYEDTVQDSGSDDTGGSINYFGLDWYESYGTISCSGEAIEQSECFIWE